jgi:hypothetical protein
VRKIHVRTAGEDAQILIDKSNRIKETFSELEIQCKLDARAIHDILTAHVPSGTYLELGKLILQAAPSLVADLIKEGR